MATKQTKDPELTSSGGVTGKLTALTDYVEESKAEIKKVTWPTKKEARMTSIAVLILVVVMSLFLGVVDLGLTKIVELILTPGV